MKKRHSPPPRQPNRGPQPPSRAEEARKLAKDLGIQPSQIKDFSQSVSEILEDDQVVLGSPRAAVLPPPGKEMIGSFKLNHRGFGFIIPDSPTEHGDLFVPAGQTGGALTGDRVRAKVIHQPRRFDKGASAGRSPYVGQIVEVVQRGERRYTGNLIQRGHQWLAQVDGKLLHDPVVIRDPHAKNAKPGDKVVIELIEYPSDNQLAEGVILEVLGESGLPDTETLAVMRAYGLADKFPDEVNAQARAAAGSFHDQKIPPDREDLTGQLICTIDPPDAKDFDDAISITRLDPRAQADAAAYELGVHIADVSEFIPMGGELDKEAYARGNSTYLPRRVVPMLPEVLSNGVCSLQEGVNRFCKTAFIRYDAHGHVVAQRFANTVIRSAKRLTYIEAQALIDDDIRLARQHTKSNPHYPQPVIAMMKLMDELAKVLRARRVKEGMISLALPEVTLVFDDHGYVVDAVPEDNAFTHTIIEMFMVEANEAAARLFDQLQVPLLRRVHPDPEDGDLSDLRQFVRVAGYNIPQRPTRTELQNLLNAVKGKPAQYAVNIALLKSLSKAEYSPKLIGHFALASEHYAHFTSPIRRYPDLMVHRALKAYLEHSRQAQSGRNKAKLGQTLRDDPRCPSEEDLQTAGAHCSLTERNAEDAERDLRTFLVLELLSNHLGEDFDGTVTGMTGTGVFIRIDRYLVDGFIPIADLPTPPDGRDRWKLNRTTGTMVAQRSGKTIAIGDRFVVRIANVRPTARVMELVIVEQRPNPAKKTKPQPQQPRGARGAQPKNNTKPKHAKRNNKRWRRR